MPKYPEGIRIFTPHESAPDFVKGTVVINPKQLLQFIEDNAGILHDYNGEKQLKLQLKDGKGGLYMDIDTYGLKKEDVRPNAVDVSDLPF